MPRRQRHRLGHRLREHQRRSLSRLPARTFRRLGTAVAIAIAAAVAGCSNGEEDVAGPELAAHDFRFEPAEFLVTPGQQVTITFVNRGKVPHNLSVPSIPVDLDFEVEERGTVIFVPPNEPGGLEFFCKFHADRGMRGTFRVQS